MSPFSRSPGEATRNLLACGLWPAPPKGADLDALSSDLDVLAAFSHAWPDQGADWEDYALFDGLVQTYLAGRFGFQTFNF